MLIKAGAQINTRDLDGATALLWAAERGMTESVAVLLEQGADIELSNDEGWTALFESANRGHVETVRLLLKQGALPTAEDSSGASPADYARSNDYQEVVDLLEGAKASSK